MAGSIKTIAKQTRSLSYQKGFAFILVIFIIGMVATGIVVSSLNKATLQLELDVRANKQLTLGREAVLSYVFGVIGGSQRPGALIRPDVTANGNYDGEADAGCFDSSQVNGLPLTTGSATMVCLGRLPWKDLGLAIDSPTENDSGGVMPWYAVSGNVLDICLAELNPGVTNQAYLGAYPAGCPGTPASGVLPYPWLTVRDKYGNVLSDRVAAVIFMPGPPNSNQSRPSNALAGAAQYLDSITVSSSCGASTFVAGTYSNADMDNDFIKGDDSRTVSDNDPCFSGTYRFNDKLVYITIDDLMAEATKRVAAEAKSILTHYHAATNLFPYAAALGSVAGNFDYVDGSYNGMLPIDAIEPECSCSSPTHCTCDFTFVESVRHTRESGGSYTVNTGSCTFSGTSCTCTGEGLCRNTTSSRIFECTATGVCTLSGTGVNPHFIYTPKSPYSKITVAGDACINNSGSNADCTNVGTFKIGLNLPTWFTDNLWQNYFYYHWSAASDLQVGTVGSIGYKQNVQAILTGTGAPIATAPFAYKGAAQTGAPSTSLDDYLDSDENTDEDNQFEATSKIRNSSYNDQVFIVAP